ncbi:hypothetical protein HQQ80_21020 [Microbacteriaceae bacterium VKM Ac-2855]|nr:hypothetical protein [Microbacteriaceae bacterium VKM Ac-2855]
MDTQPLRALVASTAYVEALARLRRMVALSIDPAVPEGAWELDAKKIAAAGLEIADLEALLVSDRERFAWFVALKLKKYAGAVIDDDNPYGFDLDVPRLRYFLDVLLTHLVEYALLGRSPLELEEYLRGTSIPGAKKYGRELATIAERATTRLELALR